MTNSRRNPGHESAGFSAISRFGGFDQLDWLMILLSVLIGTIAKQHHFLQLPTGFLEWVLPFLLMIAGYKVRGKITELIDHRRAPARNNKDE